MPSAVLDLGVLQCLRPTLPYGADGEDSANRSGAIPPRAPTKVQLLQTLKGSNDIINHVNETALAVLSVPHNQSSISQGRTLAAGLLPRAARGIVPETAKRPVLTIPELEVLGESVTINDLCDDYLKHVQDRPDLYKEQLNPPQRPELTPERRSVLAFSA